jgi:DNA-binding transcriptional MerR regulator
LVSELQPSRPTSLEMQYLKTSEAATLLNVSANTLRAWESRFEFPTPQRSLGNHRMYLHCEVLALRDALRDGLSVSSSVHRARKELSPSNKSLMSALGCYDRERADAAIEAALKLRSVEHSVDEVLLPALAETIRDHTVDSAAWAFAARWGVDWLRRATRLAPPRSRPLCILLGDASRDELDPDAAHIRALELYSAQAGAKVLSLSTRGVAGIRDFVAVHRPALVVLAGAHAPDEMVARWTHAVRLAAGPTPVALYRRGNNLARLPTAGTNVLPPGASDARQRLFEIIERQLPASSATAEYPAVHRTLPVIAS